MPFRTALIAVLVFFVSLSCQAQTQAACNQWTFFNTFQPSGISDQDIVVGSATNSDGNLVGYIGYPNGSTQQYVYPGALWTLLTRRNTAGVTAGLYRDSNQYSHGLVLFNSNAMAVNYPGAVETIIYGINSADEIVGIFGYGDFSQPYDGFLMSERFFTPLAYPGAEMTNPMNINSTGTIVGWYVKKQSQPPFPYDGFIKKETYQQLDYPNVDRTLLNDINSAGVIAGTRIDTNTGAQGGFIYVNGTFKDVMGPQGVQVMTVDGINDENFVTGTTNSGSYVAHCQ